MVAIRPFRALRYHLDRVGELSRVIAPPYDVIDAEEQERLYQRSPYNVVRLILGKQYASDTLEENRYTRAQRDFTAWRADQILREDSAPACSLIAHAFKSEGQRRTRLGVLALLELQEGIEGVVYRHEATLAAPKEDRTKLLDAVPASLEPIFCLYPDAQGAVQQRLERLAAHEAPEASATLGDEEIRLWRIAQAQTIEAITRHLAATAVLIADGHHRFEVAYANRRRYGTVLTYFVSMADPGVVMKPIHRVIHADRPVDVAALKSLCRVEPAADYASVMTWLESGRPAGEHLQPAEEEAGGRFGLLDGRTCYRVTVHPERMAQWLIAPSVPLPIAALDVSLLHGLILPSLGINGSGVQYAADATRMLRLVAAHPGGAAWLLRGLSLPRVYALAAQGLTLPPKSTYFYPKVPSGLAIAPLQ